MDSKLGILAGGGELPGRLIQICRERGRPFHVIAIEGQADPEVIGDSPQTWLRLGAAQKALEVARKEKLDEIVMVGPVRRPSIVALRPDALAEGWSRDRILHEIAELGFPAFSGSCSEIYLEKCFQNAGLVPAERLPIAKELGETSLMFLVHPTITSEQMAAYAEAVRSVIQKAVR